MITSFLSTTLTIDVPRASSTTEARGFQENGGRPDPQLSSRYWKPLSRGRQAGCSEELSVRCCRHGAMPWGADWMTGWRGRDLTWTKLLAGSVQRLRVGGMCPDWMGRFRLLMLSYCTFIGDLAVTAIHLIRADNFATSYTVLHGCMGACRKGSWHNCRWW